MAGLVGKLLKSFQLSSFIEKNAHKPRFDVVKSIFIVLCLLRDVSVDRLCVL